MIVVDTNVLAYLYIDSAWTQASEALLARDADWRSPPLWRSEFRNLIVGYARRGSISWPGIRSIQQRADELMRDASFEVESEQVLQLAEESDCSAYDCEFVALAIRLDVALYTMDRKILRAFPGRAQPLAA